MLGRLKPAAAVPPAANLNHIQNAFCCRRCEAERPPSVPIVEWSRLVVGQTGAGIQVWCERHDANVVHFQCKILQHDGTCAPSKRDPPPILDRLGLPVEATPEQVGEVATEIEHAASLLADVPFGAVRAAVEARPALGLMLPAVLAAEAFVARAREGKDARELALLRETTSRIGRL